jgi:hypothetical protein
MKRISWNKNTHEVTEKGVGWDDEYEVERLTGPGFDTVRAAEYLVSQAKAYAAVMHGHLLLVSTPLLHLFH